MKYVSTRGEAPVLNFEGAMLSGLARDGGLYVPQAFPTFSKAQLVQLRGKPYADVSFEVCRAYVGNSIPARDLRQMVEAAYSTFDHRAVAPLKQLRSNQFLLELFHGPTIAFKDVAMQLLSRMMDWSLARHKRRAVIVGATSGDTGGAAVAGFEKSQHASLYVLHPHGRVSDVQRRQMTTVQSPSVHNIAIEGSFDDCQAIVKALFNDHHFRDDVGLAGINSINWARIMAQIVYYVYAGLALGAPDRAVSFCVPTGNFGNIFAAFAAKRMGLPVDRLVIATNSNDILHRTLQTGNYEVTGVHPTSSPSMDIQVSSNFERLVYLANGKKAGAVKVAMASLAQSNAFGLKAAALKAIRAEFSSGSTSEAECSHMMRQILAESGELIDPHTAIGLHVAYAQKLKSPLITLATAHPAKFPDAVKAATGMSPRLPPRLQHLMNAKESFNILPARAADVKQFILDRERP